MERRLDSLAWTERLLIGCDFDGTLAPIAPRPELARASPAVMEALRAAARLPRTSVAVVSGRAMADLRGKVGDTEGFWLVGGHGASISGPGLEQGVPDVSATLDVVSRLLLRSAPVRSGFLHERKPAGIAVHYRSVADTEVERVLPILTYAIAIPAGLRVKHGKKVIEFMAGDMDKGQALAAIRRAVRATGVIFIGDDQTDEDAFRVLGPQDAAVRIGTEPTEAEFTVDTIEAAQRVIIDLVRRRREAIQVSDGAQE